MLRGCLSDETYRSFSRGSTEDATETDEGYQLREPAESYLPLFEAEKSDIGPGNTCFFNINE